MIAQPIAWFFTHARDAMARGLIRMRVTPNMLTVLGCLMTIAVGVCLAMAVATGERFFYAFAVVLLYWCAAADMLDGAVARLGGKGSAFGAFLDSSLDRISDAAIWSGLAMGFAARQPANLTFTLLSIAALVWAILTSYTKARAENLIESCPVGFWQRGERFAAVLFAALAGNPGALLLQQGISPAFTVWRRIRWTRRVMEGKPVFKDARRGPFWQKVQIWQWPQGSWGYDLTVLVNIAWLLLVPIDPTSMDILGDLVRH